MRAVGRGLECWAKELGFHLIRIEGSLKGLE